ncbi:hypothetical protein [Nostoc sp. CENA543]|uniref:hypothetical protein n=1 Tax=Nostoc sp. CENA543 TaxID=1869241 RepID=UPI0013000434|nr:hypothetical protein [Nostoc sp. CENA543]
MNSVNKISRKIDELNCKNKTGRVHITRLSARNRRYILAMFDRGSAYLLGNNAYPLLRITEINAVMG